MKKLLSILLVVLMMLQALPVAHWLQEIPVAFVTLADEAADDNCKKDKESKADIKAFLPQPSFYCAVFIFTTFYALFTMQLPLLPHLELSTPPPDAC